MDRKHEVKKEAEMDMELEDVVADAAYVAFLLTLLGLIALVAWLAVVTAGRVVDRVRELRQTPVEMAVYPEPVCEACGKVLRDECECAGMEQGGSRDPSAHIISY